MIGKFPRYWYGFSMGAIAALGVRARVSVCNDSGPAHLIGTAGGRVLALCGPTIRLFWQIMK
jgi:ADP-heptose:LPS heptosyltransferase